MPDAACRKRLYREGLNLAAVDLDSLAERLEGVSAAFIRELLRKAALLAAGEQQDEYLRVTDSHISDAFDELILAGVALRLRWSPAASRSCRTNGRKGIARAVSMARKLK